MSEIAKRPLAALIVEDSPDDASLLVRELEQGGYSVDFECVLTAEEMHLALASRSWDIVLSDYSLPRFSGPAAIRLVRERAADLPIIIVSGTIGEETAVSALHAGANDFILKGRTARLIPAIERCLRERGIESARKQAEAALRESEERYRRIVETANEGICVLDSEAGTTFVNGRMAALLGHPVDALLARPIFDFVHPESRSLLQAVVQRREGTSGQIELRFEHRSGSPLWVLLESTPIFAASGTYAGALAMVMDVTQRKRLEEQLRQAQKMEAVGNLAGGIAHDFNNLLSVILSCTDLALNGLETGSPLRADLEEVKKASERGTDVIRQLLAFSRRQAHSPKTLDVNAVLRRMESMLRRLLGENIELSFFTADDLWSVHADLSQLEQVVMNLAVNAADAMPAGGKLGVETSNAELHSTSTTLHSTVPPGRYVSLSVSDTGVGIDPEIQDRIFEPFFTTKGEGRGTGLGLSTVFGIVKQSRGHISVQSRLGSGTTFKILLPRAEKSTALASVRTPERATSRGSETILLVEDEAQVRATLRKVLQRLGYQVLEAQNGAEALLISEQYSHPIQLLVTDIVMPQMGGREVAKRIAWMRPELKVLLVSGYSQDSILASEAPEAGVHFLQKPVTPDMLAQKVRALLDPGVPVPDDA